ncbi:MAG: aminotransferase class III-fold pyridoxal phosphate-dependent enzyme [bacterium]|nr:aminotransferase class III-fold pyridoxal phosphate-dependent enzyme [bacterium]
MGARDFTPLMKEIAEELHQRSPRCVALNRTAAEHLVDGGSHTLRLVRPVPPRIVAASGAWIEDEDGHRILDFWQGHLANVLGNNPEVVTSVLAEAYAKGFGLQTGAVDRLQSEVAEILCRQTGSDYIRFTTSGTLANLHAVLLAGAFTGRDLVMKVGGGWHGAHPWSLKGVSFSSEGEGGFSKVESEGIPASITDAVVVTGFNDPQRLADDFARYGDRLACFVVEPVVGAGGSIPATREYLKLARELATRHGVLLILDEVITGFRFRAGDASSLWGIKPDLLILGKAIGGGMPVAAVAGRADVLELSGQSTGCRVGFSGGTYCGHPSSMLAAKTMMNHLVEHEDEIYPRLARLGARMREVIEAAFTEEGILARCTGHRQDVLPGSSVAMISFPRREDSMLETPEAVYDPAVCDTELNLKVLPAALLLEDVNLVHSHGAVSSAHIDADLDFLGRACSNVAQKLRPFF